MPRFSLGLCCALLAAILIGCSSGGNNTGASNTTTNTNGTPQSQQTASLSPRNLNFSSTVVETSTSPQSLTLTNNSGSPLSITGITASGPFSQMNNCFGAAAANASCTINVIFSPTSVGAANGSITVVDSASNTPQTATLTGTGTSGFVATGSMSASRAGHTATLLENGMVLIAAGSNSTFFDGMNTAEVYDPTSGTFTPTGNLPVSFLGATATLLDNGKVLIAGGTSGVSMANAEIYDPATKTFTTTGNLNAARAFHTATLLGNGKVLIAGGLLATSGVSAELYDPATGTFTATGSMVTLRYGHTATLLNNGMVLVAGGNSPTLPTPTLASAELYDPASGTFTATGSMSTARHDHTANLLNNGEVLITGGNSGPAGSTTYSATAELYNPATATFTLTGSMSIVRAGHTATLLNDGVVLIAGGNSSNSSGPLANAELYDPNLGTFAVTQNMTTARAAHTATLLTNGNVFIAGGAVGASASICELYLPGSAPPAGLVSIAITPSAVMLSPSGTQQFVAIGTFSDNSMEVLQSVIWSSSNQAVAEISNDESNHGIALAVTTGTSTITASAGSVTGSAALTVQ
jgi:hypothetical protein